MQTEIPNFINYMKFGVELETLQSGFKHESDNAKSQIRLQYAQTLNEFRDSLMNENNKNILCKHYYHFEATPIIKSRERIPNATIYKCTNNIGGPTWTIDYDGSVMPNSSHPDLYGNTEIISPPLRVWIDDTKNYESTDFGAQVLNTVMNQILPAGGKIKYGNNDTASTHVHLSCINPLSDINYFKNPYYLLGIVLNWQKYQNVFYSLVSESRRSNQFCKKNPKLNSGLLKAMISAVSIGKFSSNSGGMIIKQIADNIAMDEYYKVDRKYGFNLQNLVSNGIGTIEVRIHHATSDPLEIYNWVLLLSLFINSVMKDVFNAMNIDNITKEDKIKYYESIYNSGDGSFDEFFDKFIKSNTLKKYYFNKYDCGVKTENTIDDPDTEHVVKLANEILSNGVGRGGVSGGDNNKQYNKQYKKIDKKIFIASRNRNVYKYNRKEYVKINNKFVLVKSLR